MNHLYAVARYLWVFPAGNGTLRLRVELPMVQSMEVFCWQNKLVKNVEDFYLKKKHGQ